MPGREKPRPSRPGELSLGAQLRDSPAISVAGGSSSWINRTALLEQVPAAMQIDYIYATTSALYVDFSSFGPNDCTDDCMLTKVSVRSGAPHGRSSGHTVMASLCICSTSLSASPMGIP